MNKEKILKLILASVEVLTSPEKMKYSAFCDKYFANIEDANISVRYDYDYIVTNSEIFITICGEKIFSVEVQEIFNNKTIISITCSSDKFAKFILQTYSRLNFDIDSDIEIILSTEYI